VLAALAGKPPYDPPLRIATAVPGLTPTDPPLVLLPAPLMPIVLEVFIQLEAPNVAVDGLYARILATLELSGDQVSVQAIRRVMTEGEDHQEAFKAIHEWLQPHTPAQYLRSTTLAPAPVGHPARVALQNEYRTILEGLHAGYSQTTLAGATKVNTARDAMLASLGAACEAVATAGFLVTFDPIADPRFAAIPPPP
jgi:predicted RNase H-like HicB family nuclease